MNEYINFKNISNEIRDNKMVLPDFQRAYVWNSDSQQKSFLASILARIPLGNIITFADEKDSFACKKIGSILRLSDEDIPDAKVKFLLDGQQRLTTLTLMFSNRLFIDKDGKSIAVKDLVSPDIRKRFFIKLPRFDSQVLDDEIDFFGFLTLNFPFEELPEFCSRELDATDIIKVENFNSKDDKWFVPTKDTRRERAKLEKEAADYGAIPLFWMLDNDGMVRNVLTQLATNRYNHLHTQFNLDDGYDDFNILNEKCNYKFVSKEEISNYTNQEFTNDLNNMKTEWVNAMCKYLQLCIEQMRVNIIDVDKEGKERAIDIYEALNIGGIPLSTYDLVIAKAAKVPNAEGLNSKLISKVKEYYDINLLKKLVPSEPSWNCEDYLEGIKNNRIEKIIINQFLNLLCIVSNFGNGPLDTPEMKLNPEYCKEKRILKLTPKQICDNSEKVMESVLDALMYLQLKQGVYKLSCIWYNLSLLPVAYAFYITTDKKSDLFLDILNAWYLTAIFTDFYQMNQSSNVIKHIYDMYSMITLHKLPPYFDDKFKSEVEDSVLNIKKYNDLDTLLYRDPEHMPSKAVCNYIWQFYLSDNSSVDILKNNENGEDVSIPLHAWKTRSLQGHHFIPLYADKNLNEPYKANTSDIRDSAFVINSPLNMVLITKWANGKIGGMIPAKYINGIPYEFFTINGFSKIDMTHSDSNKIVELDYLERCCEDRYNNAKAKIYTSIKMSVQNIKDIYGID